jgi:aminoglycoside phosphotransferase (APT) family kinase protein
VPKFSEARVREIAARHGLRGEPEARPKLGMVNEVWVVGDAVLRIAPDAEAVKDARIEAEIVPIAVSAGVRTPELLAFEDEGDHGVTVYRRAPGVTLGATEVDRARMRPLFRELGEEMAKLHRLRLVGERPSLLSKPKLYDTPGQIPKCRDAGTLSAEDADAIERWLERLRPQVRERQDTLIHNDLHAWNVLVGPETLRLTAVLDWGDGGYGDPAYDFAGLPLWTLTIMLDGYREAGGEVDDGILPTLLWQGLDVGLWEAREMESEEVYDPSHRPWWRWPPGGLEEIREVFAHAGEPWRAWGPEG